MYFQYLNLRYNQTVRVLGSILFLLKMLLYIPIVIYVPALAFSQGKNIYEVFTKFTSPFLFSNWNQFAFSDSSRVYSVHFLHDTSKFPRVRANNIQPLSNNRKSLNEIANPGPSNEIRNTETIRGASFTISGDSNKTSGIKMENNKQTPTNAIRASSSSDRPVWRCMIIVKIYK